MKKIRKTISLLSLASASTVLLAPALATSCSRRRGLQEYHLLNINDIHGAMAGYGEDLVDVGEKIPGCLRIAREINKIKNQYPGTILLSAGDENSGEAWSVCDHAGTTYPILKAMGVRYAAVGNHAFEWGLDDIASGRYDRLGRTEETEGNYFVASNILQSNLYQNHDWCIDPSQPEFISDFTTWYNQKVTWADPYKILEFGPAKVCLIGLATQNTLIDGNKAITQTFSFIDYNAAIHYTKYLARKQLGEERFNQIDSFILLTHCDSDYENNVLSGEAPKIAGVIDTDIDAIISAHSHKVGTGRIWNNKLDKPIWMAQGGSNGKYLVDTKLIVDPTAKPGKRMVDVSMSLHQIPIPKTKQEAIDEWNELQFSEDKDLAPVVDEYARQKAIVEEKVTEVVANVTLDKSKTGETQPDKTGEPFDGYYNGLIDSGVHIGHAYYDCKKILDHFGAWACRALMLGYSALMWEKIQEDEAVIPSAAFITQDSLPSNLPSGEIRIKNMFAMQPYDNYASLGYVNIMQLASIINYSLSGNPETAKLHGGKGFSYEDKNQYEPDLCYYVAYTDGDLTKQEATQVAFNILDDNGKATINSGYTCGIMPFYGVKVKLQKIDDKERDLDFKNPITKTTRPVYDSSAEYRVATHTSTINGTKVTLPTLWVYDGINDGKGTRWGSIDKADDPTCWKSADDWWAVEHPNDGSNPRLIPVLYNSFNYGGGNTQTKMFSEYAKYCVFNYGIEFYPETSAETIRDFVIAFCRNSVSETREWAEYTMPTDITWTQAQHLVEGI